MEAGIRCKLYVNCQTVIQRVSVGCPSKVQASQVADVQTGDIEVIHNSAVQIINITLTRLD
jgi:hypothetical protein